MTTRRNVSVLYKRPGFLTASYEVGDVVLLSREEADRVIAVGDAVPCRADIDATNITRLLAGLPDQGVKP